MKFTGTMFERLGAHGSRIERAFSVPWDEASILAAFGQQLAAAKDQQQLWACARYAEGASRGNAGILANTGAVLDADCTDPGHMDATIEHLRHFGLAFFVYTSWSHGLATKLHGDTGRSGPFDCYRVVIPYSRECTPAEHTSVVEGIFGHELPADPPQYAQEVLGRMVTLPSGKERAARPRGWDPVCARPAQAYYAPSSHAVAEVYQGHPLDVDAVLQRPTTARPTNRGNRPYQDPTAGALGAFSTFQRALKGLGYTMTGGGYSGWARSTCPSCKDPSPSLTARPNGDGIDMRCHAGCKRNEVLDALGLSPQDFPRPQP